MASHPRVAASPRSAGAVRFSRLRTVALVAGATLLGATCRDGDPTGPGLPVLTSVAVAPVFQMQVLPGGPKLRLAQLRVRLTTDPAGPDTMVQTAAFDEDSAVVVFDVSLAGGVSQRYRVMVEAVDAAGDTLFRGADTVRAFPNVDVRPTSLELAYTGPDAGLTAIDIVPGDTILDATDSLRLHAVAEEGQTTPSRMFVGWTSRDAVVLQVSDSGTVRARSMEREVWVVGQLFTGVRDSVLVRVRAPVASITLLGEPASVYRGDSLRLQAEARDSAGTVLTGRNITWSALDPSVRVDTAGMVHGVTANATGRVVAAIGTHADTVVVTVMPVPVAFLDIDPNTMNLVVGDTASFTVTAYDERENVNPDWSAAWSSSDPAIASVDASTGRATAVAPGTAWIRATVGGVVDSSTVEVSPSGPSITSTLVTPRADTAYSLGDTIQLAAQAYEGTSAVPGEFAWVSRTPAVATVDASGRVVAIANGASWIVATEAGGTRDSALVTVEQRVSTVSVSPVQVQRYLGGTQQFTANAVDGRGNAVTFARFAWSSTAPGVVSVDTGGNASMVGLGSATVRATAGGITGQADVTVISAITRIVVSPDSVVLGSFGISQGYTATAYDTLNAPMSNVTFAWVSTNPSVAPLSGITSNATSATAAANGNTRIQASAQGVTGSAFLTVRQVLSSIEVTPGSTTIGPSGRAVLTARGKDQNGYYLTSNPAFTWNSLNPEFATVDGSGVVTGVAQGQASITASSGQATGSATVFVSNTVPQSITFGRDTIKLGRGTSNSIPIYLATPPQGMVIVDLAALDTIAWFPQARDTFPTGQTSINVALNTRNAGTTRIIVSDVTGAYADTTFVTVQANVRFSTTSLNMVATDQRAAQVLLSDPAPAGGAYVTYQYSVANVAQISPEPAFVPGGQLAADIVVRGMGSGNTIITPLAQGTTGANTLNVSVQSADLRWYYGNGPLTLGAGQYQDAPNYVSLAAALSYPLTVTLASSDTTLVRSQTQVTIPAGTTTAPIVVRAVAPAGAANVPGLAAITASAPGFASSPGYQVRVTRPGVGVCCNVNLNTTSGPSTITVSSTDSIGNTHYRINSLRVAVRSGDTTVVKVASDTVTIAAGQYYVQTTVRPGGIGDTAWVYVSAAGHFSDSIRVIVAAPSLRYYYGGGGNTRVVGAGQWDQTIDYVYLPNAVSSPVSVTLTSSDPAVATATSTVIVPAGSTTAPFSHYGHATGQATITATATGYSPVSYTLKVSTPRISVCCNTTTPMYRGSVTGTVYAQDSLGNSHLAIAPVPVTWRSSDAAVASVDSATTTIAANSYYSNTQRVRPVSPDTAYIVATGPNGWGADSFRVIVTPAALGIYYGQNGQVGERQLVTNGNYISIPDARSDTVIVTVTQFDAKVSRLLSASLRINPGQTTVPFSWEGVTRGTDTLTFSAAGYTTAKFIVRVMPRFLRVTNLPANLTTTSPLQSVQSYTVDSVGNARDVADTVYVRFTSTETTVLQIDTIVAITRGVTYSPTGRVRVVGAGTARIVAADTSGRMAPDTSNLVTVTGPALRFYYGGTITTGMRQRASTPDYVAIPNPLAQPLTVTLESSDPRVATPTASVTIPAGATTAPFNVTGGDTVGTIQLVAKATGYSQATTTVQVGAPRLFLSTSTSATTTTAPGAITVYLQDHVGNYREAADSFTVALTSTQPGVAAPDSATITFRPGMNSHGQARMRYLTAGSTQLIARDPRTALYAPKPDTVAVSVATPLARLYYSQPGTTISLGIGQRWTGEHVYIPNAMADTLGVTFAHNTARATIAPSPAVIPAQNTTRSITVTGLSTGSDTVVVGARNHASSTYYLAIGPGRTTLSGWPSVLNIGQPVAVRLYVEDPAGTGREVAAATTFTLVPNQYIEFRDAQGAVITQVTVPAGASYTDQFFVHALSTGTGSATIGATDYQTGTYNTAVP